MTIDSTTQSEHEEIMLKLPWLLNGTLPETEANAMQNHVAHCDQCQSEIASLSLVNNAIDNRPYETGNASASLHKMRERIAAEPNNPLSDRANRFFAALGRVMPTGAPPQWAIASVGGLLLGFVVLVQTGIMGNNTDDVYQVHGSGDPVNSISLAISLDTSMINDQTGAKLTEATEQMALDSQLVETSSGGYRLTVIDPFDDSTVSPEKVSQLIETVRAIPGVTAVGIAP